MSTKPPDINPLARVIRATGYSREGLLTAWRTEASFRIEVVIACLMLPMAWWLGRTWLEVALLSMCVLAVLLTELLNSAIEAVVDMVSPGQHPMAKAAKDIGSAAVFVALCTCTLVWGLALWHRLG